MKNPAHSDARLHWLPVALFGAVMGLAGLSQAWRLAHLVWGTPSWLAQVIGALAVAAFAVLVLAYGVKAITGPAHVRAEWDHPVGGALFGTPLIAALLLPLVLAEFSQPLARALWVIGALGMSLFAMTMAHRWLNVRQQRVHAGPTWIVPLVGMLDIPLAVPALGWAQPLHGMMVWGLSVGLFFAVPLFTTIWSRLVFEEPLPAALSPSLLIVLAPFAVGFSAYVSVKGEVDLFAQSLLAVTLFLLPVLVLRLRHLRQCCPFRVSWWAVSFPLAATAVAGLRHAQADAAWWSQALAVLLLTLASVVIALLGVRTLAGVVRGELQQLT